MSFLLGFKTKVILYVDNSPEKRVKSVCQELELETVNL